MMRVRVTLTLTVDDDAWRAEYAEPDMKDADIRDAVRAAVRDAAESVGIVAPDGIILAVEDTARG